MSQGEEEMKKTLTALLLATTFSVNADTTTAAATATAPSTSTSQLDSIMAKIKKAPVSINWLLDAYANSDKVDGATAENYFYIGYKIDKNHKVTVTPILTTDAEKSQRDQEDVHTKYLQTDLTFQRSNILKEAKHGINLTASLGNSFYKDNEFRAEKGTGANYSRHHLSLSASKTLGKLSLSSGAVAYTYNRNTGTVQGTQNYTTLSFTPTYSFSDNLSASLPLIWYNLQAVSTYANGHTKNEKLRFVPSLDLSVGKFAAGLYYDGYIAASHDIYDGLTSNWLKKGYVGLTLSYSLL